MKAASTSCGRAVVSPSSLTLTYRIDPTARLVRVDYHGHPTFWEWSAIMQTVFSDPDFAPGFAFLFDKRRAQSAPDNAYVEAAVHFYQSHREMMGRCAIVVSGLLAYGMGRMTASLCGPEDKVQVFTELAAAEQWLLACGKKHNSGAKFCNRGIAHSSNAPSMGV